MVRFAKAHQSTEDGAELQIAILVNQINILACASGGYYPKKTGLI